jgi:hypothetical protein
MSLATQLPERPKFIALDRMHARGAALQSPNVQVRTGEIDLIPLQIDRFGDPQAVPRHDQDQRRITMPVSALTSL